MLDSINDCSDDALDFDVEEEEIDAEVTDDDVLLPLSYFDHSAGSTGYKCKHDIINRIKLFNEISRRIMSPMVLHLYL